MQYTCVCVCTCVCVRVPVSFRAHVCKARLKLFYINFRSLRANSLGMVMNQSSSRCTLNSRANCSLLHWVKRRRLRKHLIHSWCRRLIGDLVTNGSNFHISFQRVTYSTQAYKQIFLMFSLLVQFLSILQGHHTST